MPILELELTNPNIDRCGTVLAMTLSLIFSLFVSLISVEFFFFFCSSVKLTTDICFLNLFMLGIQNDGVLSHQRPSVSYLLKSNSEYYLDCLIVIVMAESQLCNRMVLGYAYPAYECFKTVEKNKPEIEQLRFWCQYWYVLSIM